jgi:alpha-D-xyloside xylohydrolase
MTDEFMFGRSILACPIVDPQYTEEKIIRTDAMTGWNRQSVSDGSAVGTVDWTVTKTATKYLPKGADWYDFWTGKRYAGGKTVTLETQFNRVPMFVRAGSIIPMGPVMQYIGEKQWDELELRVYPGADGTFTLYEDEGDSYNYEKGAYTLIPMQWSNRTRTLTIGERQGNYPGMIGKRTFNIITPDGQKQTVEYAGQAVTCKL